MNDSNYRRRTLKHFSPRPRLGPGQRSFINNNRRFYTDFSGGNNFCQNNGFWRWCPPRPANRWPGVNQMYFSFSQPPSTQNYSGCNTENIPFPIFLPPGFQNFPPPPLPVITPQRSIESQFQQLVEQPPLPPTPPRVTPPPLPDYDDSNDDEEIFRNDSKCNQIPSYDADDESILSEETGKDENPRNITLERSESETKVKSSDVEDTFVFKGEASLLPRHGRVQSVKLLSEDNSSVTSNNSSNCSRNGGRNATVSFIDIRSAAKAFRSVHSLAGQSLHITYHEPGSVPSRGIPPPPDHPRSTSPCTDDTIVNSENGNNNPLPTLPQGSSTIGVVGVNGPGPGIPGPGIYRQQRFPPQHPQPEDSSSHFYEQPKGFSRGRGDGRGFHGGRGRREHRHYNNRHSSFPVESRNNYRWGYPNEGRFAPPAHSETDERNSVPPSVPHVPPSETGSKGPRRPDSPASSVSSRHMPSKKHKSRSVSESGSSDPGSSPGSRSGSRSSVSTSMSSGRSRSPPHHGPSGHYSRGGSSGGRFQQNSYSRQRYSRSRLVSRPADSSRARHSSRSSPVGASPSSSTSSSPSPHRKIASTPHSPSHSPSSAKSYSPSRSVNPSTGHRHHQSNNRKIPSSAELNAAVKIRNLPSRSSDSSLKDGLYHEYKKHGKVSWVRINGTGSERFAIVCFKSPDHATRAVALSQEKLFFGCKIQVTPYNTTGSRSEDSLGGVDDENRALGEDEPSSVGFPTRTVLITGLDPAVTSEELRQAFDQYGDIVDIDIRKVGANTHALCEFIDISSAIRAQWGRHVFKSREAKISFYRNPPTSSLLLDGTSGVNDKQLANHCSPFGVIKSVIMDTDRFLALVQYEEISSAQTALRELRSLVIKGRHLHVDSASLACIRMFISRISNGLSESLPLSPSLRSDSLSPPLPLNPNITRDSNAAIRRLHNKNLISNGDRRILYRQNEFDPEPVKQNAQTRIYKGGGVEIGVNSHLPRVSGPENQFSGSGGDTRHRRHEYTSPVSPPVDNVIVNGDRGSGRNELHVKGNTKIDLSCHETDSAIVTSSSDVISVDKGSPQELTHHLAVHNHIGSGFPDYNCDERQLNNFESVNNMINRKLNTWSKPHTTIVTMDGVSSTSPEPKTETVRKASPDPGVGLTVFEPVTNCESQTITTVIEPRKGNVVTLPRRSSADSGNNSADPGSISALSNCLHKSNITACYTTHVKNRNPESREEDLDDRPGTPLCDENPETFPSSETPVLHQSNVPPAASMVPKTINVVNFGREGRSGYVNHASSNSKSEPRTITSDPYETRPVYASRTTASELPNQTRIKNVDPPKVLSPPANRDMGETIVKIACANIKPASLASPPTTAEYNLAPPGTTPTVQNDNGDLHNTENMGVSLPVPKDSVKSTLITIVSPSDISERRESMNSSPVQETSKVLNYFDDSDSDEFDTFKASTVAPRPMSSPESSDSEGGTPTNTQALDQRIQKFYERYDEWSGSRNAASRPSILPRAPLCSEILVGDDKSTAASTPGIGSNGNSETETEISASLSAANSRPWFVRSKVLDLDEMRQQPSDIVKSLLAKKSVFDDDSKRLENFGEKYEAKVLPSGASAATNWRLALANRSASTSSGYNSSIPTSPCTPIITASSIPPVSSVISPRNLNSTPLFHQDSPSSLTSSGAKSVRLSIPPAKSKDLTHPVPPPVQANIPLSTGHLVSRHEVNVKSPGKPHQLLPLKCTNSSLPTPTATMFAKPNALMSPPELSKAPDQVLISGSGVNSFQSHSQDPRTRTPGKSLLQQYVTPLPSPPAVQITPVQSGIHHGIPRMVERSMSLDSKRNNLTGVGFSSRIPTFTSNAPGSIPGATLSFVNSNNGSVISSVVSSANGSISSTPINRRISVDSQAQVQTQHRQLGNSIPAAASVVAKEVTPSKRSGFENDPTKKKIQNIRSVKELQKPTPSLTIVSDSNTNKEEPRLDKIGHFVKDDTGRLDIQHLQESTVAVVASIHQSVSSMEVGKEKEGNSVKNSTKRDKDVVSSKKGKRPDHFKSLEPPSNSSRSSSGKDRKLIEKSSTLGLPSALSNDKSNHENLTNHYSGGSGSRHHVLDGSKKKEKEVKVKGREPEIENVVVNAVEVSTSAATASISHKRPQDKDKEVVNMKRRLSTQESLQERKKVKVEKEKHVDKDKIISDKSEPMPGSVETPLIQNSHHHHHHHRKTGSTGERRESRDSGSSSKDKASREKPMETTKLSENPDVISPTLKDKSEHHHHRSKSSGSSSKHHHRGEKEKLEKSNTHSSSKDKEKMKTDSKDPAKENHVVVKESSSVSSKHSSSSGHTHSRHGSHHRKSKGSGSVTTSGGSLSRSKEKEKDGKSMKEKLISTSSSMLMTSVDSDPFEILDEGVRMSNSAKKEKESQRDSSKSSKRDRHKSGGEKDRDSSPVPGGSNSSKNTGRSRTKEQKKKRRYVIEESDSPNNDSDDEDEDDKQKHHSIFEVVVDEYVSMYDKVKARSNRACKNNATAKQQKEEQRKQEKLQESFQQLKKSRAKREEKKRSTSIDERKSLRDTSSEDEEESHQDSDLDSVQVKRRTFDDLKPLKSIVSSDEDDNIYRHSSTPKAKSQFKVKNHSKRDSVMKKPSSLSTCFASHSDEDSSQGLHSPNIKRRKLGTKHQRQIREHGSSSLINRRSKSSDESLSDTEKDKSREISGGSYTSTGLSKASSSKSHSKIKLSQGPRTGAGIYSESDSSSKHSHGQEGHGLSASSSSKALPLTHLSKSKRNKASKQKSIDAMKKSLFDSSESSGTEEKITKRKEKDDEKSRSSRDRENKCKPKKKSSSHWSKGSSSASKSGSSNYKKESQREGRESESIPSQLIKRESISAMKVLLFGAMSSTSESETDEVKISGPPVEDKPKTLSPAPAIPVHIPSVLIYPETPLTSKKDKSKSESRSQRRNSSSLRVENDSNIITSSRCQVDPNTATPLLKAASSGKSSSSSEKKKRKLEKKSAKRSESQNSSNRSDKTNQVKMETSVDYDSLFSSPVPSPERIVKSVEKKDSELPICFDTPKFFPLPKVSPSLSVVPVKCSPAHLTSEIPRDTIEDIKSMFSTDEDDDDDNRLKIDISEAIMASDEPDETHIPEPEVSGNLTVKVEIIDAVEAATTAISKRLLEEEEKKRHCLFEQDKAIESILTERKSPPRTIGLSQTQRSSNILSTDIDIDEREAKDDIPKDDTAISQEETEDAVAALLETLVDRDDTIEEETNISDKPSCQRSPPTLRIIEESSTSVCGEKEIPNDNSPWYTSTKSPPNDLQIDEGDCSGQSKCEVIDLKSSTESLIDAGVENLLEDFSSEKKELAKRTSSPRSTRSRQGSSDGANSSADVYEFHDDSDEDKVRKVSPSPLLHSRLNVTPTPPPTVAGVKSPQPDLTDSSVMAALDTSVPPVAHIQSTKPVSQPSFPPQSIINIPQPVLPVLPVEQTTPPTGQTSSISHVSTQPNAHASVPVTFATVPVPFAAVPVSFATVPVPFAPLPAAVAADPVEHGSLPIEQPVVQLATAQPGLSSSPPQQMPVLPIPMSSPSEFLLSSTPPLKPLSIDCPQLLNKQIPSLNVSPVSNKLNSMPASISTPIPVSSFNHPRTTVDDTIDDVIRNICSDPAPSLPITVEPEPCAAISKPSPICIPRGRSRSKSKDTPEEMSSITATINRVARSDAPSPQRGSTPTSVGAADIFQTALQSHQLQPKLSLPMIETRTDSHVPLFISHKPSSGMETLIDPETGVLIPMIRQSDEGQYIPVQVQEQDHHQIHHLQMSQSQQHHHLQAKLQKNFELERVALFEKQIKCARPEGLPAMLAQQQLFPQQPQHFKQQMQSQHVHHGKPPDYQFHGQKQLPTNSSSISPGLSQKTAIIYNQGSFHPNLGQLQSGTPPPPGQFIVSTNKTTPTGQSQGIPRGPAPSGLYGTQQPPQGHHNLPYPTPDGRGQIQIHGTRLPMNPQQILRPGPPLTSSPQLLTAQPSQQLVRIPQIPSATTITKVDSRAEEQQNRKLSIIHPNVIVTTTNGPAQAAVHGHQPQQPRPHESFGQAPPRVEISGNVVSNSTGSPKAGRVPPHEQSQPQSSQQRVIPSHHIPFDPSVGDVRSVQTQLRPPHDPAHYVLSQTSHQQVVYPHHYIPVSIGGTGGGNLPPDTGRQPSPLFAIRPGSVPADAGTSKATHQQDGNKQLLDRPLTSHVIPPHLVSPHTSTTPTGDRSSTESPHLVPHPIYPQRQTQLYASQSGATHQQHSLRQTFLNPYADFEEQPFSHSPGYHHPGVGERDYADETTFIASSVNNLRRVGPVDSPPPAHISRYGPTGTHPFVATAGSLSEVVGPSTRDRDPQTPPLPVQGDSLLTLLQRYPIMWQGLLALKNDNAACQMHFVSGNMGVARDSLPSHPDGSIPPLRISQRMRLEQTQLEGVARKMQLELEHCILLALPCGRDHMDVLQQSTNLRTGFITYLQLKQAAGIVNIHHPVSQMPAYVIHIFPSCDFANENLARIAPDLLNGVADIAHLLIVIATV